MALSMRKEELKYTYGDYLHWPEGERWEIIEGVAYDMSPAPTYKHQFIAGEIYRQLANYLLGKPCIPFIAPCDVVLPEEGEDEEDIETVVQPDIVVICDRNKIANHGRVCVGAPDMVIEILSPSTAKIDTTIKKALYERAGVRELWIVYPDKKMVIVYLRNESKKYNLPKRYDSKDTPNVHILPGLRIDMSLVFADYGIEADTE